THVDVPGGGRRDVPPGDREGDLRALDAHDLDGPPVRVATPGVPVGPTSLPPRSSAAKNIGPVAAAAGPESGRTACACVALAATRVTPAVTASAAITSLDLAMCCSFLEEGVPLKGAVSTPI